MWQARQWAQHLILFLFHSLKISDKDTLYLEHIYHFLPLNILLPTFVSLPPSSLSPSRPFFLCITG